VNGKVFLYANEKTQSIKKAVEVTRYRRMFQKDYNKRHNITPKTIIKRVVESKKKIKGFKHLPKTEIQRRLIEFEAKMQAAAARLDFENAIEFRDRIQELEKSLDWIIAKENRKISKKINPKQILLKG
jgi:excinuclease ABC subunit B